WEIGDCQPARGVEGARRRPTPNSGRLTVAHHGSSVIASLEGRDPPKLDKAGAVALPPSSPVLRGRQQPLLSCVGAEGEKVQALGCAAAAAKAGHRAHELKGRARAAHGVLIAPVGGSAAKPRSCQSADLTQAGRSSRLIAGDVVDLERAGVEPTLYLLRC